MDRFTSYIKNSLHMNADASDYGNNDNLPLYLRTGYDLSLLTVHGVQFLLAQPKEQSNLTALRKQVSQLKKLTGFDCVLCLENVRKYSKEKMLSEGIPFVVAEQQIYMPFLGIALARNGVREIPQADRLSFSTQKLLLSAIYQGWKRMTLTETANALNVSKMSITRSFDELQSIGLNLIKSETKARCFFWDNNRRALWEKVQPYLRNPVMKKYMFSEHVNLGSEKLAGLSAICYYSMLVDNPYKTIAITKAEAKELELSSLPLIPKGEAPDIVVYVMLYDLAYQDNAAVDPLSAILSLSEDDKDDPRVEMAIEEILEVHLSG